MNTKKTRDSNIELLRMLAMFYVLLVHADFYSLGVPSLEDIQTKTFDSTLRIFFESLGIVCVNVFVLISGWFGIRPSMKGVSNFIFQVLFFNIGIFVFTLIIGTSTFSFKGIAECFVATKVDWFIKAYLFLYILSPILNAFVDHVDKITFRNVLIAFFAFSCTYGWLGGAKFFIDGYTPLLFIGLYLLARYMRIYKPKFATFQGMTDLSIYAFVSCCVTLLCVAPSLLIGRSFQPYWVYVAPTTIIASVYLLLFFTKLDLKNKFVNWCGASSFAVFLLHFNPNIIVHFKKTFAYLYLHLGTWEYWGITFILLILIFAISILIDQLRIFCWKRVEKNILKWF